MPITQSSAKVQFTIGSFDYDTSLSIPSTAAENQVSLQFNPDELISPQLVGWGSNLPYTIYGLIRVTFDGQEIYVNDEFNNTDENNPPVNPDITIEPDGSPATIETVTINNYVPLIPDVDGTPNSGTYTVEIEFMYKNTPTLWETEDATTFSATLGSVGDTTPILDKNWDTLVPVLRVEDKQSYEEDGVIASTETEFVLYPPESRSPLTSTFTDEQKVQYPKFYIGGNQVRYTVLAEYETDDSVTIIAEQDYLSFTVYDIDRCAIYNCLDQMYSLYIEESCSGRLRAEREQNFQKANSLALQIITGQSCGTETLSAKVEEFNELCGCNICLDDTPRQVASDNIIDSQFVQFINATEDALTVDFSAGYIMIITLANNESGMTQITPTNYDEYGNYRMVFVRAFGSQIAEFTSEFKDSDGTINNVQPLLANRVVVDLFASTSTELNLVNRNDGSY